MHLDTLRPSRLCTFLLLSALFALTSCGGEDDNIGQTESGRLMPGGAGAAQTVERGVVLGDRELVLNGFSGSIKLTGTNSDQARFTFTKRARGDSEEDAQEGLEEIQIKEQGDEGMYRYTFTADDPDLSAVDIRGEVPVGTNLRIVMDNGTVELSTIEGPVAIEGENLRAVRIAGAAGSVDVQTRNGDIELGMERLADSSSVRLNTTNGDLWLVLPSGTRAQVEAQTTAGEIDVEGLEFGNRELEAEGAGARFSGVLGGDGADVRLETENGSVSLLGGQASSLAALTGFRANSSAAGLVRNEVSVDSVRADSARSFTADSVTVMTTDSLITTENLTSPAVDSVTSFMADRLVTTDSLAAADSLTTTSEVIPFVAPETRSAFTADSVTSVDSVTPITADSVATTDSAISSIAPDMRSDSLASERTLVSRTPLSTTDSTTVRSENREGALAQPEAAQPEAPRDSATTRMAASVESVTASVDSITAIADSISALADSLEAAIEK